MSRTSGISTLLGSGSSSLAQTRRLLSAQGTESAALSLDQALSSTAAALAQLESAALAQAASITKPAAATSGSSSTNAGQSLAESMFGGLTLTPIVRGLMSLFGGGGDSSAPAALPRYTAPYSISMEGGVSESVNGPVATDYGQNGQIRTISPPSQPQVTVNVQAMDSQSFLDRSGDIARAVKRAMLESNSLNDVVSEI